MRERKIVMFNKVKGEIEGRYLQPFADFEAIINYKLILISIFDYMYHI